MDISFYSLFILYLTLHLVTFYFGTRHFYQKKKFATTAVTLFAFITCLVGGILFLNFAVSLQIETFKGSETQAKIIFLSIIFSIFISLFFMLMGIANLFLQTIRNRK